MNTTRTVSHAVKHWLKRERMTQLEGADALSIALPTMKSKLHGSRPWKLDEIDRLIELDVLAPLEEKQK